MDYNTQRAPGFYMEQLEHTPYHKERVAYFRWMYNKDPGHQYAKLGPLPPRAETDPECPCPKDLNGETGIPGSTQSLWRDGVPMPVDPSVFAPPKPAPTTAFAPNGIAPTPSGQNIPTPQTSPQSPAPQLPLQNDPGIYDLPTAPVYGPSATDWGGFRVINHGPAR